MVFLFLPTILSVSPITTYCSWFQKSTLKESFKEKELKLALTDFKISDHGYFY